MSARSKLSEHLTVLHGQYLEKQKQHGGTAAGWRQYATDEMARAKVLGLYRDELILMALTKKWQEPPRKNGPDLFSIGDYVVPDTLTRVAAEYVDGDDIEGEVENKFEKVDHRYATLGDFVEDRDIKLRKAAQSSARANAVAIAVDVAMRRAKGNLKTLLRDIANK
jgi:hypothetical protein